MPSDRPRFLSRSRVALLMLLAITLAVRVGVLVAMQVNLQKDPDAYHNIANNLLRFGVYGMGTSLDQPPQPTAYRPPLYPLVLAKFASDGTQVVLWRVALVHVVLGLATVWLTWVVAGQFSEPRGLSPRSVGTEELASGRGGERERGREGAVAVRFIAGLLVACDPLLLNQSTLVMTETLAAFLTVLCLLALHRFGNDRRPWNAGLAGCTIGLAILCRPTYLPWLVLVGVGLLVMRTSPKSKVQSPKSNLDRSGWRDWLWRGLNVAALGLIAAVVVSPWAIRNQRIFGKPIVSTTHGGYTLYLGNNRSFYEYLRTFRGEEPWDATTFKDSRRFQRAHDDLDAWWLIKRTETGQVEYVVSEGAPPHPEILRDRWEYRDAWQTIKENKPMFLWSCLYRLRQFWSPLPHRLTPDESLARTVMRYVVAAWYVGVYLLAAVGIWKLRGKLLTPPWLWGLLLCLVYTGIHTFYWTNLRMRAPLMPFVALVAAYGFSWLWQRFMRPAGRAVSSPVGPDRESTT